MFAAFFYLLRQRGLHVSLNEWMTLLEGMEKGPAPLHPDGILPPVPGRCGEERNGIRPL